MKYNSISIPLFPFWSKYIAPILIIFGLFFGYLYFFGGRPAFFEIPVFAIVSSYMESRFFVMAQTNILDELAAIFLISGVGLVTLSKEKKEKPHYNYLRLKALIYSIYISLALWMLIFLLVYGWAIFIVSGCMLIVFLIIYYIVFQYLAHLSRKEKETSA